MSESTRDSPGSLNEVYTVVVAGLRSRRAEVAEAIYASIPASGLDVAVDDDAEYQAGRVAATAAIVEYSLDAIERGEEWGPIPPALVEQTRRTARMGVRPGVLVRLYLAGHRRFMDFIREEVGWSGYTDQEAVFEHLRATYHSLLEHIIASVEHEHDQERERLTLSPEQRRIKLVRRLLVEDVDPAEHKELDYDVGASWHLGVIANGVEGAEILRGLKLARGQKLLLVPGDDGTVWAWLGSKAKLTIAEFKRLLSANRYPNPPLAIGEPGGGLQGWRQTHEEAQVAALIARHELSGLTRCVDALPIVGALQNEALIRMYEKTYILPLNRLRKGGQPARKALLAYCKHGHNASSAGDAINASRRTVENHINDARKVLGDPLNLTALEIALWLEQLGYMAEAGPPRYSVSSVHRP